jgi:urease accessory protein
LLNAMLTLQKLIPQGRGLAGVLLKRAATVELDWDVRQKSRFDATDSQGRHLGVFLPRGSVVRGGDVLLAEDGSLVRVLAAPQPVLEVRACAEHGSPFDLVRAAYHLGNRHVPLALAPTHLTLEPDHVLADMLRQMHLTVTETWAPFEPEGGAYAAGGHGHSHAPAPAAATDHVHGPGCGHDHGAHESHSHAAPALAPVPHVHGPGCGHDHAHEHGHTHGDAHHNHGAETAHAHSAAPAQAASAQPGPAAPSRGKPLGIAVTAAPAPHVHGPGCGHGHSR